MDKIITTSISDPSIQQPFTGKSLDFLQEALYQGFRAICDRIITDSYDSTKAYILYGVLPYGTNQYSSGFIYYSGEIYYTTGKSTITAFVNIPVMTITTTNDLTADPVTFTDGVSRNVHNVRRIVMSDAVSGSGTFDLANAIYLNTWSTESTPTASAYTTADVLVGGGITLGTVTYKMKRTTEGISLYFKDSNLAVTATAAKLYLTLPISLPTVSSRVSTAYGFTSVRFYKSGTGGVPCFASIVLLSSGAGQGLMIEKADGTAFGALSGYTMEFKIDISFAM